MKSRNRDSCQAKSMTVKGKPMKRNNLTEKETPLNSNKRDNRKETTEKQTQSKKRETCGEENI